MKLTSFQIREFRSIIDSTDVAVDEITCLVGKNEAGKTSVLDALYRLRPYVEKHAGYNIDDDYPRTEVEDYKHDIAQKKREPVDVVEAKFEFEPADLAHFEGVLGKNAFKAVYVTLNRGYGTSSWWIDTDDSNILKHLVESKKLPQDLFTKLEANPAIDAMLGVLAAAEKSKGGTELIATLNEIKEAKGVDYWVYKTYVEPRIPTFLYFDEYYQMEGCANIETLKERVANPKTLENSDRPLLGLLNTARLNLDELLNPSRTVTLLNKLQGNSAHLTKKIVKYWSQNRHLSLRFDVRPACPEDPPGMRKGNNLWGFVDDAKRGATTGIDSRSKGFVWFFSFLAWYSDVKREGKPVILLLDEPGLSLHAKAQEDLLKYFEEELKGANQLIYTTHSPFMVDPKHFDRVRIVQDLGIERDGAIPREKQGTKVLSETLEATKDSLFPLQAALGYEIHQTLFIGPNSLVVEGVSDLIYLQVMSALLEEKGRAGLHKDWTITPVGGSDKVATFVALIGAQSALEVAVLIDFQKKDKQTIENLYKARLLEQERVNTYAKFTGATEADVEDMFDPEFFIELFNAEYVRQLQKPLVLSELIFQGPRIVKAIELYLEKNPTKDGVGYNHFRPARYLSENIGKLKAKINDKALDRFEVAFRAINGLLKK